MSVGRAVTDRSLGRIQPVARQVEGRPRGHRQVARTDSVRARQVDPIGCRQSVPPPFLALPAPGGRGGWGRLRTQTGRGATPMSDSPARSRETHGRGSESPRTSDSRTRHADRKDADVAPRPTSSQNLGGTPPPGAGRAKKQNTDGAGGPTRKDADGGRAPSGAAACGAAAPPVSPPRGASRGTGPVRQVRRCREPGRVR